MRPRPRVVDRREQPPRTPAVWTHPHTDVEHPPPQLRRRVATHPTTPSAPAPRWVRHHPARRRGFLSLRSPVRVRILLPLTSCSRLGGSGVRWLRSAVSPWSPATRPTLTVPVKSDQEPVHDRGLAAIWRQQEAAAASPIVDAPLLAGPGLTGRLTVRVASQTARSPPTSQPGAHALAALAPRRYTPDSTAHRRSCPPIL